MANQLRGHERSPEFAKALELLEEWGAAILVAGEVDERAMQSVISRMMGAPAEDRYRVLALLNDNDPAAYLPGHVSPAQDGVRVVQRPMGRAAVDADHRGGALATTPTESDVLEVIRREILTACEAFADGSSSGDGPAGEMEPGKLRIAVDTLQPLIMEAGIETVVDWLQSEAVPSLRNSRFRARSHWTYYGLSDGPTVESLMASPGLFDVLVRVRRQGRAVDHKWVLYPDRFPHLSSRTVTSWLPADS